MTGTMWMDREWSTSALGPDEVGWDWFALHLADGRDVMLYRLRRRDGTAAPLSKGSVSPASGGAVRRLALADYTLRPVETWTSPHSGARYPVAWEVAVPSENLRLRVTAVLPDQELNVSVRYWEGAVDVTDAVTGAALGRGYLEMTGYGDEGRSRARHAGVGVMVGGGVGDGGTGRWVEETHRRCVSTAGRWPPADCSPLPFDPSPPAGRRSRAVCSPPPSGPSPPATR